MKLHLPKGLRAALIAAVTAIGFTLPQAYAAETLLSVSPTEKAGGNVNITWTGGDTTLNSWKLNFDLTVTNGNANDFFNINSNNSTAQAGWAIGTNGTTLQLAVGGKNGSPVITLSDAFTIGTAQNVTFQFERDVDDEGVSLGTGTFTIIANGQTGTYAVTSLDDTALVSGSRGHIWCNGNPGEHQLANITLYQLDDHQVVVPTSTWNGTDASHDWGDSVWNGTETYTDGNKAVFGTEGYTTVSITTAVQAGAVSVSSQNYTFETNVSGSLTAAKMSIAEGASLTVKGTEEGSGEVAVAALSGAGNLTVGEHGTATVTTLSEYTGSFGVTDGGTLNLGASIQLDNLTVADGTVTTQHSGSSGVIVNDLNINAGGVFRVAGQHDAFGWGGTTTKNIILTGEEGNIAELQLQQTTGNSVTMNAALQLKGYASITTTKNGFNTHDGSIYAEGVENSIDKFQLRHAATIEVAEDGVLTVGDMTYGADGQHILTKAGKGTLTFTGTANMQALHLQDGVLAINGGTVMVENIGTAPSTINKTIDLQAGSLDITTAVLDISGMGGITTKGYSDGQVEGNGFATVGGNVDVVNVGVGATLTHEGVQVKYNGMDLTMDDQGDVDVEEQKSLAAFYVNVDGSTESLSNAVTKGEGMLSTVDLGNNTTLAADSADAVLTTLLVRADASATVALTQATTFNNVNITTKDQTLTFTGTGSATVEAITGAGSLVYGSSGETTLNGSNTAFTGDVTINAGTVKIGNQKSLGEHNNGASQAKTITIAEGGTLDVNGKGDANYTYTMAGGKLTNSGGDLGTNLSQTVGLVLTENSTVEAFNGKQHWLRARGSGSTTLTLGGHTLTKVGDGTFGLYTCTVDAGTIEVQGGDIKFQQNGSTAADIVLNGGNVTGTMILSDDIAITAQLAGSVATINASDHALTLDGGGELTLGGAISGATTLDKNGTGTAVLTAAMAATSTTAINVNEGTLKVSAANALGSGAITVAADATLDLVNGGALGGTQIVTNGGNVTLHSTLTQGTVSGGVLTLASDFPVVGEILDVDDTDTGNGFSQGGVMHVYTPGAAALTGITGIVYGETHYQLTDIDENGDITSGGADWYTYQLNGAAQYAVQAIMDYAAGKGGELKTISVNGDDLSINNDSTTLKTSMLGGEHLSTFAVYMSGTSNLTIDGDCGVNITANAGADSTITLEKDATIGSLTAADAINQEAIQLTVTGNGHTLKTDGLAVAFDGTLTLDEGVKLEMLPETAFTSISNANMVLKRNAVLVMPEVTFATVDGGDEATIVITSDDYLPMYSPEFAEYSITGARITYTTAAAFDLGHVIDATSQVVNAGTGSMRDISANGAYAELNAQGGNIFISAEDGVDTRDLIVGDLTLAGGRTVAEDTGKAVSITVNGTAEFGSGTTVGAALTMAGGSTLDGTAALASHALSIESGVNIGESLWSTLTALAPEASANIFTGVSALTLAGAEYTDEVDLSTIFTHDALKANRYTLSYDNGNVIVTKNLENNRYWKGGDGTWNYSGTVWTDEEGGGSDVPFVSGYNAHFTGATNGTVTLGENITAESITVSGADYIFQPGGHTLTVNKSVEADGHKATFNMALNGENLKLIAKNGGTITLNNGGSVKDVEVGAAGTIRTSGALTVTDGFTNTGNLVQADTLTIQKGTATGGNVTAVAALNLTSGQSYAFGDLKAGTVNGTGANLTIGETNTLTVDNNSVVANLTLGNGATVAGSSTMNTAGVTLQGDATVTGKLAVSGMIAGTGCTLKIENGELSAAMLSSGVGLATSGTTTITSTGVTLALKDTVDNASDGTVTFVGNFEVGHCDTVDGTATYVGGGSTANGFKQAQKIVSVIDEGTAVGTAANLTYNGKAIGQMNASGKVTFQGDTEYDKFYVNSGSESASTALDNPSQRLGTFELKAGTTLVADRDIDISRVNAEGAATLDIAAGTTVTSAGQSKPLTLKGAGTFALNSGVSTPGVALDSAWAGTVSFTEAALTTLKGSWKSGSTVSLTGVTGSLGNDLIEATVVLNKGTGDWGFGQTATVGTPYTNLEGTLTGDGNLGVKGGSVSSTFNLDGDIDGWTGNFIVDTDADTTLNLGGSGSKTVNGSVSGSNLTVNVQADTTFEGALNVDVINVDNTKAATLKADSTARWVDAYNGTLKVNDGKTLTVTDTAGPEGLKLGAGARIVLPGAAYLGGEDYGYVGGTVANGTSGDQAVGIHNANITATGATLRADGGTGFTVDNKLVNATLSVENALTKAVVLSNVQDSLEVAGNLEIGTGGSLKVANGTAKQMLNISSGTLTTGTGSVVDANLNVNSGVTTDMAAALDLNGGALTLNKGLTLSGNLYDQLAAIKTEGQGVQLFSNVGALTLTGSTGTSGIDATLYFTNLLDLEGDYKFRYEGGALSILYSESSSRQLVWDGTDTEHRWVAYEEGAIDPQVQDWYQTSTSETTYFVQGDVANFDSRAENKQVVISDDIEAKMVAVKGGAEYEYSVAADSTLTSSRFEVKEGAVLDKTGSGELSLKVTDPVSVDGATMRVSEGSVRIYAPEAPGTLALANAAALEIAKDTSLVVSKLTGSADSTITVNGMLSVAEGSVQAITAGEYSTLAISGIDGAAAGTLAIASDTTLYEVINHGTLDLGTNDLTLMLETEYGGNVTAGTLNLAENGNSFGNLKVNTIHYAYGAEGEGVLGTVNVNGITANGTFPVVTLDVSDTMHGDGSLAPVQRLDDEVTYTLVHSTTALDAVNFTLNAEALELLKQNGLLHADAGLVKTANDVTLTVGGLDLTWYTDNDVTEWGYKVVNGDALAAGANTLNGVQHVVVEHSRTVDVTGVGSAPGLRVRNITGPDGRTITFTGTETDTVNLITTEETRSNVNVAAQNITLKVGLDALDEMDPVDYKDLRVGDVTLTGATLDVHAHEGLDDSFTVDSLNGDAESMLKGTLIVEGTGGAYRGEYEDAYVGLHEDAEQALYAGEGLTIGGTGLAKLAYTGVETHMDGIEGIGMTVVLNSPEASNIGATLVLDNTSWLAQGTLVTGMSAVDSALTLDTPNVPNLLDAPSMRMDGTTVIINQTAGDDASIAMAVNDGGYKRGLLLAYIGADDSYTDDVLLKGHLFNKYYTNARLEGGRVLVDRNRSFYTDKTAPTSENGKAGAGMLDDALLYVNPQVANPDGDLAAVMTALEKDGYSKGRADKVMAAMSGASHAAMGAAWNRDVDRQLRAIRNRTTQMGLAECTVHEGLPYVNAWINAEGDYSKLNADGTLAGYKLTSWGGTLGVDVDFTSRFTMGAAVTAMSGDFTANSMDRAEGDLDRLYVSVFGRYTHRAWTHTFVATYGMADTKLKRTVDYTYGSYSTDSSSDGKAFGLMYEVGYVTALNEDASTCLQPVLNLSYRHSSLDGCGEQSASDAALRLGDAEANVFTVAAGARLQSIVGTSVYNRASIFEGRVMLKFDTGDRDVSARNGFLGVPGGRDAKSTEAGMFGVEVGAGITIPLSENAGALFFDVTGDFRAKDTELNGTVGYRFNF